MNKANEFVTGKNGSIFQKTAVRKINTPVIKSNHVVFGNPKKIKYQASAGAQPHQGNAFPLMDGDTIIGFVYECSCGEVTKILFDYEQEAERAAG